MLIPLVKMKTCCRQFTFGKVMDREAEEEQYIRFVIYSTVCLFVLNILLYKLRLNILCIMAGCQTNNMLNVLLIIYWLYEHLSLEAAQFKLFKVKSASQCGQSICYYRKKPLSSCPTATHMKRREGNIHTALLRKKNRKNTARNMQP